MRFARKTVGLNIGQRNLKPPGGNKGELIMATWQQRQNMAGLVALHAREPRAWKVVDNRMNEFATAIMFKTKREAEQFQQRKGGILVPPLRYKPKTV